MHGQFVWYELTTPDVAGAQNFYPQITGWGTQKFDNDYTMWTTGGAPFAGIFRLTPQMTSQGIPPNWMPYVEADDVDKRANQAASLGGKIVVAPQDIPGTGRFAVLQDPQGATFGIYKSTGPSRSWDGTQVLGRFSWHELMTTDYQKAFEFYRTLFGWDKTGEMDMGGGMQYLMYGQGETMFGGIFDRTPDMSGMQPFWLCYILVADVQSAVDVATRAGATLHRGPMEIPGGVIAILGDPQGAGFAVHHQKEAAAAPTAAAKKSSSAGAAKPKVAAATKPKPKVKTAKSAAQKKPTAKKTAAKKTAAKKKPAARKPMPAKKTPTPKKKPAAKKKPVAKKKSAPKKPAGRRTGAKKRGRR